METWTKGLFLLAIATDLADGYLARRLGVSSNLGAYFDATADFFVIMSTFAAFAIIALYPAWLLIIIASMFTQFLVTSRFGKPVYDPIGRHYGTFLFAAIGLTLAFPSPPLWLAISDIIAILTIAAITSRCIALFNREVGAEHSQKQLSEAIR
jgi:CDP-diacylglycerol--glycerol-3-phosphate 3-phosphatidyltransferase/cardiolipin synthase